MPFTDRGVGLARRLEARSACRVDVEFVPSASGSDEVSQARNNRGTR